MARGPAQSQTSTFRQDLRYWLGENHWPTARSWNQNIQDSWKARGVRNYLFATIDHKAAVVLDATPRLRAEPLDGTSTLQQREQAANATRHELERNRWDEIREDVFLHASVGKIGVAMVRTEQDRLSGEHNLKVDVVDPTRFYPDPSATRLRNCRYVVYEPQLDISIVKEMFPEKADKVKPTHESPEGRLTPASETRSRSDDELVYTTGREIAIDKQGMIKSRKADVTMVWIRDESLTEDVQRNVIKEAFSGYECFGCGIRMDQTDGICPNCGSNEIAPVEIEPQVEEQAVIMRQYPFGRWIVYSGEVLLYDGPNPLELDEVFPFAVYTQYRVPIRFHGYGDVDLLKSSQMQADKNISQLIDAMRMTGQGFLEYPKEATAYDNLGNEPGQKVAVPFPFIGKTHWVTPQGYNAQLHSIADEAIIRDFQRVSGVSDVSIGSSPTAPTSGVEVQARQRAAATRIGRHLKNFNQFCSDLATLSYKVINQYYVGVRPFMMDTGTAREAVAFDASMLPKNLHIRVEADVDALEKDKLAGQNLVMAMQSGIVPMYPDLLLRALGTPEPVINEVMQRIAADQMAQEAQALAMGQGITPNGAPPVQARTSGPQGPALNNSQRVSERMGG